LKRDQLAKESVTNYPKRCLTDGRQAQDEDDLLGSYC